MSTASTGKIVTKNQPTSHLSGDITHTRCSRRLWRIEMRRGGLSIWLIACKSIGTTCSAPHIVSPTYISTQIVQACQSSILGPDPEPNSRPSGHLRAANSRPIGTLSMRFPIGWLASSVPLPKPSSFTQGNISEGRKGGIRSTECVKKNTRIRTSITDSYIVLA